MPDIYTEPCYPSWICSDCAMMLANGESPVDMDETDEQAWWEAYATSSANCLVTPGMLAEYHNCGKLADRSDNLDNSEIECDCDRNTFRDDTCALCKRHYGGEMFAVTFWIEPTEATV